MYKVVWLSCENWRLHFLYLYPGLKQVEHTESWKLKTKNVHWKLGFKIKNMEKSFVAHMFKNLSFIIYLLAFSALQCEEFSQGQKRAEVRLWKCNWSWFLRGMSKKSAAVFHETTGFGDCEKNQLTLVTAQGYVCLVSPRWTEAADESLSLSKNQILT